MTNTLFDVPPSAADVLDDVKMYAESLAVFAQENVRPDDREAALRAAAKVKPGRKAACAEVYGFVRMAWPNPVEGSLVVSRFLGTMRDPERRLRELRTAMEAMGYPWRLVNHDGRWSIVGPARSVG
jgi:hypothetical protein